MAFDTLSVKAGRLYKIIGGSSMPSLGGAPNMDSESSQRPSQNYLHAQPAKTQNYLHAQSETTINFYSEGNAILKTTPASNLRAMLTGFSSGEMVRLLLVPPRSQLFGPILEMTPRRLGRSAFSPTA